MRRAFILLTLISSIGVTPASAQGTAQERSDCMGDAFKFCSSDIPFVSEIEDCLRSNMSRLSKLCRREFAGPDHKTKLKEEHFQ